MVRHDVNRRTARPTGVARSGAAEIARRPPGEGADVAPVAPDRPEDERRGAAGITVKA